VTDGRVEMAKVPIPKEKWSASIGTISLGDGRRVEAGGSGGMPLLHFDGKMPFRPLIAGEVWDTTRDFPETVLEEFGGDADDPVTWARRWVELGIDLVCLRLMSTNPEGEATTPEEAAATVMRVTEAVDIPLIVYGCGNTEQDAATMEAVGAAAKGSRILIGQAEEDAYKSVSAAAMANGHAVIAFSNLDINLAKQMNILLTDFGVEKGDIVMDPLMAALGMGLEYSYSVNERIRLAALMGDRMLQVPMLCDATASWQVREATDEEMMGDPKARGTWWEVTTALAALISGADILLVRGPEAVRILKDAIDDLMEAD
jgi:acetyl-CoA decarbonylase/synthase complex subunit delta